MPGKIRIAWQVRQRTLPPALIRLSVGGANAECEGRVSVEEELVYVVVVDDEKEIRFNFVQPGACGHVAGEQRRPGWLLLLPSIPRHPDRRSVRCADTTDCG